MDVEDDTSDRLTCILSAQQRRVLRALTAECTLAADPILRAEENLDAEEYITVCYELHHVLLPELADRRFITFDRANNTIYRGPRFHEIRPFFE